MTEAEETVRYLNRITSTMHRSTPRPGRGRVWRVFLDQIPNIIWKRGDQFCLGGKKFVNGFRLLEELGEDPNIAAKLAEPIDA